MCGILNGQMIWLNHILFNVSQNCYKAIWKWRLKHLWKIYQNGNHQKTENAEYSLNPMKIWLNMKLEMEWKLLLNLTFYVQKFRVQTIYLWHRWSCLAPVSHIMVHFLLYIWNVPRHCSILLNRECWNNTLFNIIFQPQV